MTATTMRTIVDYTMTVIKERQAQGQEIKRADIMAAVGCAAADTEKHSTKVFHALANSLDILKDTRP